MNMIAEMTSAKPSFESSFFNESSLIHPSFSTNNPYPDLSFFLQQKNQQSNPGLLFSHLQQQQEEELEAPVNIYQEHRGHLEEDKKSRTELDTENVDDDLYCPVQQQQQPQPQPQPQENTSSRGLNMGDFTSFLPRFLPTTFSTNNNYSGVMESTNNDTWGYYHNDMFNTNNMFGGFDGINSVACQ